MTAKSESYLALQRNLFNNYAVHKISIDWFLYQASEVSKASSCDAIFEPAGCDAGDTYVITVGTAETAAAKAVLAQNW